MEEKECKMNEGGEAGLGSAVNPSSARGTNTRGGTEHRQRIQWKKKQKTKEGRKERNESNEKEEKLIQWKTKKQRKK